MVCATGSNRDSSTAEQQACCPRTRKSSSYPREGGKASERVAAGMRARGHFPPSHACQRERSSARARNPRQKGNQTQGGAAGVPRGEAESFSTKPLALTQPRTAKDEGPRVTL